MVGKVEEGMTVRVAHNFDTDLVCECAIVTEKTAVERFPPPTASFVSGQRDAGGTTTYR